MLNALIVNFPLFGASHQRKHAEATAHLNPIAVGRHDEKNVRVWLDTDAERRWTLQLFCPSWIAPTAGEIELVVLGQPKFVKYSAGQTTRQIIKSLATALESQFDVMLPATSDDSQRLPLGLALKSQTNMTIHSTDGMVLVSCDKRGIDVEVGLDGPFAAGGVITISLEGRTSRFSTHAGQHGSEISRQIEQVLTDLGAMVEITVRQCDTTYRARVDVLSVKKSDKAAA
jgi:hypothetical protein